MVLPKYSDKSRQKLKLKICVYRDCGKEYWGHPIAKYCPFHQNVKNRKREKRATFNPYLINREFKHHFSEVTTVEFTCGLEGCKNTFLVRIFPKQFVYPNFCPAHRQEHKRNLFTKGRINVCQT